MATTIPETTLPTLEDKTRELCQFIIEDPAYAAAQGKIEVFLEDEEATKLYGTWQRMAGELHQKSQRGEKPSEEEIAEFERLKEAVLDHPVAADFIEAEDSVNAIFQSVVKMLQKTLQNGKIPTSEELTECCNEGGCGCG